MESIYSLVAHLDKNEFEPAKQYLAENVTYKFRDQQISGADQVMKCYENSYESVKDQIDEIILDSEIVKIKNDKYLTNYTDILFKNGKKHVHRCYQELLLQDNKVIEIEHFDLEGELESLNQFFKENGIVRKTL